MSGRNPVYLLKLFLLTTEEGRGGITGEAGVGSEGLCLREPSKQGTQRDAPNTTQADPAWAGPGGQQAPDRGLEANTTTRPGPCATPAGPSPAQPATGPWPGAALEAPRPGSGGVRWGPRAVPVVP